ncbi:MAG: 4Fe-4S dicluster domain-containing protein [Candidatus Abyssobacteria bacterium SURF_17]|uniref:4Fe-4S dicluster domain-containing protein n=1 Tax=Candidatus Abyssobacteria bacterium SURF_17 TaxID=2093361 RepID=A0A419EX84_9BACT|nr:MAG: 4Fe-4S dicluster domain-containing protein [Candidatus Abyssubacteria bacterium SURF_17]
MSNDPYLELQRFLDQFPLGFPQTPSGIEMEILKRLFTEEEAKIAVHLTPLPEEVSQIAERAGLNERDLDGKLDSMAQKGLVFRIRRGEKTLYRAAPFMIGLYEYSVKRIDKELATLFKEYYETAYLGEMGASNVPGFKVLPVDENIQADTVLLPFHKLKESIKSARKIAVADCVCRKEARLTGEGCTHPIETCLSFGAAAEYYIENGMGREITADEAIRIIEEADKAGLVHASANAKHLSNICNCCPCCCASMKGITKRGHDKHKYLNTLFEAIVDARECVACEVCRDRCPVGAIEVQETAVVDRGKCLGCGLCATECPSNAITLRLREDREEPFERTFELGMAILEGKHRRLNSAE